MSTSNTTTTTPTNPTIGSSFGALKYNLNELIGWRLGAPTPTEILLYSDLCESGGTYFDLTGSSSAPLFKQYDTTYSDQILVGNASNDLTYANVLLQTVFSPTDYATQFGSKDGLFGFKFFPWNPYGLTLQDGSGNYAVKQYISGGSFVTCNPMRREVLMIKLFTIMKIFGISFGLYALFKLIYHYSKK